MGFRLSSSKRGAHISDSLMFGTVAHNGHTGNPALNKTDFVLPDLV